MSQRIDKRMKPVIGSVEFNGVDFRLKAPLWDKLRFWLSRLVIEAVKEFLHCGVCLKLTECKLFFIGRVSDTKCSGETLKWTLSIRK